MPKESIIGHVAIITNRIPRRHCSREISAALALWDVKRRIKEQDEDELQNPAVEDAIFRQVIWQEGEKIISLIENSMSSSFVQNDESKSQFEQGIPVSRDDVEHLIKIMRSDPEAKTKQIFYPTPAVLPGGFAFDLILYDQEQRRLRYFYMAYGVASDRDALTQWHGIQNVLSGYLPRLAGQYFGVEIDETEYAIIDPLLKQNQLSKQVWSLSSLDQLTGKPGTAARAMETQHEQRRTLAGWFGKYLGGDEAEVDSKIGSMIERVSLEELKRAKPPRFNMLFPN